MKTKLLIVLALVFPALLNGCSGQDDSNVAVYISSSPFPLIPATAKSCLILRNGETNYDVAKDYFKVPTIKFFRKDPSAILVISSIKIKISVPGNSATITCEVAGDNLSALSATWWGNPGRETTIASGVSDFDTDCALYCGGISVGETSFTSTGTMEIFGLERNPTTLEEVPVKVQTSISVQNF
ncbi:MAG: hypothetical protein ACXVCP_17715 [Bdellovibrio sp.]